MNNEDGRIEVQTPDRIFRWKVTLVAGLLLLELFAGASDELMIATFVLPIVVPATLRTIKKLFWDTPMALQEVSEKITRKIVE